ncbi:MAG: OmpA family protein [Propionibacteriaceae bacterium]|nr:OmpA family protein [Propionibacteriaceae bacterium]
MCHRTFSTALAATLLAGCTGFPAPGPSASPHTPATTPAVPSAEPASLTCTYRGVDVQVVLEPLVRLDETTTALRVRASADSRVDLGDIWKAGYGWQSSARGIRLADLAGEHALESTGADPAVSPLNTGDRPEVVVFFGPAPAGSYTVLVPLCGAAQVPVIGAEEASEQTRAELGSARGRAKLQPEHGRAAPLATYLTSADEGTQTRTTAETVTFTLDADVTFEYNSDALTPTARDRLRGVAEDLRGLGPGRVTITGHTDDTGSADHNLDLSKRRAARVHSGLKDLIDLSGYEISVDGKGMTQPRVPNANDTARAANRRVEIRAEPTAKPKTPAGQGGGQLPEASGPVGTGAEGVEVKLNGGTTARIALPHVVRRGRHLIGLVEVTGGDPGGTGHPLGQLFSPRRFQETQRRGHTDRQYWATTGFTLLRGQQRVHPTDYVSPSEDADTPLTELGAQDPLAAGEKARLLVIWPDLGDETVVLDHVSDPRGLHDVPFRLTDIPVKG